MKKFMVLTLVFMIALGITSTVMASEIQPRGAGFGGGACWEMGLQGAGYAFFWDANGQFLSRDSVETAVNDSLANGSLTEAQRDFLLDMYEYCASLGGGATGVRCGGGGRGYGRAW